MAITQNSQLILKILSSLTNGLDLSTTLDQIAADWTINFGNGAGAGAASMVWSDTRTLAASGTEDLDLAGGLVSAFGATLTFTKLKALLVRASSANANNVQVTRPASNGVPFFLAAGDGFAIKPGGVMALIDPSAGGVTVTASTGDLITVTNSSSGTGVDYDIVIIGV